MADISNTVLAQQINDLLLFFSTREEELVNWMNGEVDGGVASDGKYPLTNLDGTTIDVTCPAQLEDDVTGLVGSSAANVTTTLTYRNEAATYAAEALNSRNVAANLASLTNDRKLDAAAYASDSANEAATALANRILTDSNVTYSEEWANAAEDTLVSVDAGGDGATEYSALHWAAKTAADAISTAADAISASDDADAAAASAIAAATFDPANFYLRTALDGGQLDNRYYTETEIDALIVTDHGALAGLTDDDHTQYILVNGTRAFSGDILLSNASPVIDATTNGALVTIRSRKAAGGTSPILDSDPDDATILYFDGLVAHQTADHGLKVFDTAGDDPSIHWYQDDGTTRNFFITALASGFTYMRSEVVSGVISIQGVNSLSATTDMIVGDPDGSVDLHYTGILSAATHPSGFSVYDTSGAVPVINLYSDVPTLMTQIIASGGSTYIDNKTDSGSIFLRGSDAASANTTMATFNPDGACTIYHDAVLVLQTRADGLRVQDTNGNDPLLYFYDDAGSPLSRIQHANDTLFITNEVDGKELRLRTYDSASATQNHIRMGKNATGTALAFHGSAPVAKQTVTGSRGGNAALASLLSALSTMGLLTDSSS